MIGISSVTILNTLDISLASDHHGFLCLRELSEPLMTFDLPAVLDDTDNITSSSKQDETGSPPPSQQPPPRKLCVRHQRMADEGTNLKLQQSLDALPLEEREAVNAVWSNFSSSSHPRRALILHGLLTMCCFSQLSLLTEQLAHLIRIDPFTVLPREVSLKVLGYLDATSLCRAAQVSKQWKGLADDDILWRGICEQHIGQKCRKCGWGLPILEKKRIYRLQSDSPCPSPCPPSSSKRELEEGLQSIERPIKRQRAEISQTLPSSQLYVHTADPQSFATIPGFPGSESPSHSLLAPNPSFPLPESVTRPWKDVYSERLTIERNWRRGRCTVRTLRGHSNGVMCLQFSETLSHPAFPVLITGSYDRTTRVWNLETGVELHCLKGHTRAVRALQFDEVKLITGSMDNTIRVWDWRRGKCIRTLSGHTDGVVSLNFDSNVLASGSVDATIKVWNLRSGGAFTLRGHRNWVNSVQLWDSNHGARASSSNASVFDIPGSSSPGAYNSAAPQIDPGKMLFSASDDGTIKLWDLTLRTCVRQFTGHVGQVQSIKLLLSVECGDESSTPPNGGTERVGEMEKTSPQSSSRNWGGPTSDNTTISGHNTRVLAPLPDSSPQIYRAPSNGPLPLQAIQTAVAQANLVTGRTNDQPTSESEQPKPILISGSLDNTIKLWDIDTGKTVRTFFGHIEGVWAVASDKLRLVSGSHDRTIKVWSREEGRCTATLVGHRAAVTCLELGEDKIVSGSDDGDIKIWSFGG